MSVNGHGAKQNADARGNHADAVKGIVVRHREFLIKEGASSFTDMAATGLGQTTRSNLSPLVAPNLA